MTIFGLILGGAAGAAALAKLRGPLGTLLGNAAGRWPRAKAGPPAVGGVAPEIDGIAPYTDANQRLATKRVAFTIAAIALGAKMAKADGLVTRDEVDAFKQVFHIPAEEAENVGRIFDQARRSPL